MANENARALRKRMTPQEVKLWVHLRALRPQGLHFRRQVPRGPYIVDFACLPARLIVEVDGNQHGFAPIARATRPGTRSCRTTASSCIESQTRMSTAR